MNLHIDVSSFAFTMQHAGAHARNELANHLRTSTPTALRHHVAKLRLDIAVGIMSFRHMGTTEMTFERALRKHFNHHCRRMRHALADHLRYASPFAMRYQVTLLRLHVAAGLMTYEAIGVTEPQIERALRMHQNRHERRLVASCPY